MTGDLLPIKYDEVKSDTLGTLKCIREFWFVTIVECPFFITAAKNILVVN